MKKKVTTILLTFIFIVSSVTVASFATVTDSSGFIKFYEPYDYETFYTGETMPIEFDIFDVWESYYTVPMAGIYDAEEDELVDAITYELADAIDEWNEYEDSYKLSGFAPGKYQFMLFGVPGYKDGSTVSDWSDWDNIPSVTINFTVKKLKAPTGLKLSTGKKKVTVSFYKVTGASKYQIYRSEKKKGGYKRIATVKSSKYVDKKAKKGKTYYYKVRAVRSVNGTVYSSYTSPKKSGKVK